MGPQDLVGYFGYGSLVNRQTLRTAYVGVHRARLSGWRRHWQSRGIDSVPGTGPVALLSVHRCPGAAISGLLVLDRPAHMALVDAREALYDRVALAPGELEHAGEPPEALPAQCHVYVGRPAPDDAREPRLLQSYVDAVMAGFLAEFGEEGVRDFIATTTGFAREIILDRLDPAYPRAVSLPGQTARWFDSLLEEAGVRYPGA